MAAGRWCGLLYPLRPWFDMNPKHNSGWSVEAVSGSGRVWSKSEVLRVTQDILLEVVHGTEGREPAVSFLTRTVCG